MPYYSNMTNNIKIFTFCSTTCQWWSLKVYTWFVPRLINSPKFIKGVWTKNIESNVIKEGLSELGLCSTNQLIGKTVKDLLQRKILIYQLTELQMERGINAPIFLISCDLLWLCSKNLMKYAMRWIVEIFVAFIDPFDDHVHGNFEQKP